MDGDTTDRPVEIIQNYEEQIFMWLSMPEEVWSDAINKGVSIAPGSGSGVLKRKFYEKYNNNRRSGLFGLAPL